MYPDFIGIGAQKAGTTWLHRNLRAHPEIWMPPEKELHYFDEKVRLRGGIWSRLRGHDRADWRWRRQVKSRFKRSPRAYSMQDLAWNLRYFLKKPDDRWYASLFERGANSVTGEITPDYSLLDRDAVAHVHEIMPQAKLIFFMRNPIERPWSVANMGLRMRGKSLGEVPDRAVYSQFVLERSRLMTDYARTLANWGTFFPPEQIFVGFLEDVHLFPDELLGRLYAFLGVDVPSGRRAVGHRVNSGSPNELPVRFAVHLAGLYRDKIEVLAERFDGYASFWLHCAQRLLEDPPGEPVPYPLWESEMWREWVGAQDGRPRHPGVQSAPLASLGAAP